MTQKDCRSHAFMQNLKFIRGQNIDIRVPLYPDENTGDGKIDGEITPGEIHMDSLQFGMSCCCLQVSYGGQNLAHAEYLHDCFITLGPILGALSAATPIFKRQLANTDYRWNMASQATDQRTENEELKGKDIIDYRARPRYSTTNHFLSDHPYFNDPKLNDDAKASIKKEHFQKLKDTGMNDRLAYHFASLLSDGALAIVKGHIEYDPNSTEQVENFNSSHWNSVRFKPPPSLHSDRSWIVEFRTLDNQITDYENAALITCLNMLTKVLTKFDVNISLPISFSNENMERAQSVDAAFKQKFWFRKNIVNKESDYTKSPSEEKKWKVTEADISSGLNNHSDDQFVEMTIADIFEGNEEIGNTGLIEIFKNYMDTNNFGEKDREFYDTMFDLLVKRAKGQLKTGARFLRDFVLSHPAYQKDSVVTDEIGYDLVKEAYELSMLKKWDESLLGEMPEFMQEYFE